MQLAARLALHFVVISFGCTLIFVSGLWSGATGAGTTSDDEELVLVLHRLAQAKELRSGGISGRRSM